MQGPRRVTPSTGNPTDRRKQEQPLLTHNIPVERSDSGGTRRYALGRELVRVTFDGDYVAGAAKTVNVKLGHMPTGFDWHVYDKGGVDLSAGESIVVAPMNRNDWTESTIQVACNYGGAKGVTVTLAVY
jgi:hypothetical protein